jgi:hypothetical protein
MKCRRCNSVVISLTGETCMCGEPLHETYTPNEGQFRDMRQGSAKRRKTDFAVVRSANGGGDLLNRIRRFCSIHSLPYTVFGKRICGDPNLVSRLQNGAIPRDATIEKIVARMKAYERGEGFSATA